MANTPPPPLSLRELARRLGVSHTAVSLALRGSPQVSTELRVRAQALAEAHGYGSNPLLSAWMRDRRRRSPVSYRQTLAFLAAFDPRRERRHSFSAPLLRHLTGAEQAAAARGYDLDLVDSSLAGRPGHLAGLLRARGIRAALVASPPAEGSAELSPEEFHLVGLQRFASLPDIDAVMGDHYAFMAGALEVAHAAGRRRIGFVSLAEHGGVPEHLRWRGAFLEDQSRLPTRHRTPILEWNNDAPDATRTLLAWADRHHPEAVVSNQPDVARLLLAAGRRIPEDILFVQINTHPAGWPGTLAEPHEVGEVAVALLAQRLESGPPRRHTPLTVLVTPRLLHVAPLQKPATLRPGRRRPR